MHGSRRRISGHHLRRAQRTYSRTQRARESSSRHPREHVCERLIHSRGASHRRPWGATGLWRAVQGVWTSAMARVSAPYRRIVPTRPPGQFVHVASTERIQRPDNAGAVNEVRLFYIKNVFQTAKEHSYLNNSTSNLSYSVTLIEWLFLNAITYDCYSYNLLPSTDLLGELMGSITVSSGNCT